MTAASVQLTGYGPEAQVARLLEQLKLRLTIGTPLTIGRAEALLVTLDAWLEHRVEPLPSGLYATPDGRGIADIHSCVRSHRAKSKAATRPWKVEASAVPHLWLPGAESRRGAAFEDAEACGWAFHIRPRSDRVAQWQTRLLAAVRRMLSPVLVDGDHVAHVATLARSYRKAGVVHGARLTPLPHRGDWLP